MHSPSNDSFFFAAIFFEYLQAWMVVLRALATKAGLLKPRTSQTMSTATEPLKRQTNTESAATPSHPTPETPFLPFLLVEPLLLFLPVLVFLLFLPYLHPIASVLTQATMIPTAHQFFKSSMEHRHQCFLSVQSRMTC